MRILVVTPWFPTGDSPVSGVFVRREVEALALQHEVELLHLDWQRGAPLESHEHDRYGYRHLSLNRSDPRSYRRARRAVASAATGRDIVHTHALTGLVPWLVGHPSRDTPWVHSEHWSGITAPETLGAGGRLALSLLGPRLRMPDAVVAESSRLGDGIRRFRSAPVDIVPCVVTSPKAIEPLGGDGVRLVAVGGMIPRKGPLLAVSALAELVGRGVDASLTWVGEGPLRHDMSAHARSLDVEDRLTLRGRLDDAGVSDELNAATMFLLPTQGDNFCVVAAEALVHGRPIVSGAATGAVDYASEAVSRFVRLQTATAYADAIQDLLAATADVTAEEIAATVTDRFSPRAVAAALTAVYARVGRTTGTASAS